jgi:hypothetical protein
MTSQELSAWMALFEVKSEEAQERRRVAESTDGRVITWGHDPDPVDDEEDERYGD